METSLDFYLLKDTAPNKLLIIDASYYNETPETPILSITLPGFTKSINIPVTPSTTTILTSSFLGISAVGDFENFSDGVYKFTYSICPNTELFVTKYYLIDYQLVCQYESILAGYMGCSKVNELVLNEIDILLQVSHIHAKRNNPLEATKTYTRAKKMIDKLTCL